jgi:hypothetical protein
MKPLRKRQDESKNPLALILRNLIPFFGGIKNVEDPRLKAGRPLTHSEDSPPPDGGNLIPLVWPAR